MTGSRRTGLIVILAVLVAGVWVAVLVRALGADDPGPAVNPYVLVDGVCDTVDYGAAFAILPQSGGGPREHTIPIEGGTLKECLQDLSDGASVGSLWVKVQVVDDPATAERLYEGNLEHGTISINSTTIEAVEGPWREGALGRGAETSAAGAEVCVRDANLTACVAMRVAAAPERGGAPTDDDLAAAVVRIAEDVLARARG